MPCSLQDLSSHTRDWTQARQWKCWFPTTAPPGNSTLPFFSEQILLIFELKFLYLSTWHRHWITSYFWTGQCLLHPDPNYLLGGLCISQVCHQSLLFLGELPSAHHLWFVKHFHVHCLIQTCQQSWEVCVKVKENVTQLCLTLCGSLNCSLPGSSVHGIFTGKNTGVGSHSLLQGTFPT